MRRGSGGRRGGRGSDERRRTGVRRKKEEEVVEEEAYLKRGWRCAVVDHNGFPMSRWRRGLVNSQWSVES